MAERDIRFSKREAHLEHQSRRGNVQRSGGNFTRGSQLFSHHLAMWWAGVRIPVYFWIGVTTFLIIVLSLATFEKHEIQLVGMKLLAASWEWLKLDPTKTFHLTLPSGQILRGQMGWVEDHPAVVAAWSNMVRVVLSGGLAAVVFCVPLTIWFVDFSNRKGRDIMKEHHARGSIMVEKAELVEAIKADNALKHHEELVRRKPPVDAAALARLPVIDRARAGVHVPYQIAGIPFPWRTEQQHVMFLGTTGTGKTTELKRLVLQARARGHRCVIFDLTGSFVESFYNPATDHILNPRDKRCEAWTIFNDTTDQVDLMNAAWALIPDPPGKSSDDFWGKAARTLFVEMCIKLMEDGHTSNGALAHHMMSVELEEIHEKLSETIAAPLVSTKAAKMAESIRATFNTHANAIRFLPDPSRTKAAFSLREWITREDDEGSILFLTSSYSDMVLTKPLLTMWMNIAMQGLFTMGRTRNLRTWFLIDEVHALHRVPAIEQGLQTARQVGGAIVLGMHSFEKLKETYGDNGAYFIDGLCGTKLFLRAADGASAKHASESLGEREVREVDEAYSYGYNSARDASTLTPRTEVKPLVIASDIRDLPDLHGFIKFAQGFPSSRVKLAWRDYKKQAEGFDPVIQLRAAPWPPEGIAEDVEGEGVEAGTVSDGGLSSTGHPSGADAAEGEGGLGDADRENITITEHGEVIGEAMKHIGQSKKGGEARMARNGEEQSKRDSGKSAQASVKGKGGQPIITKANRLGRIENREAPGAPSRAQEELKFDDTTRSGEPSLSRKDEWSEEERAKINSQLRAMAKDGIEAERAAQAGKGAKDAPESEAQLEERRGGIAVAAREEREDDGMEMD